MTTEQVESIASALREISRGGGTGPLGIEALAMAICGDGLKQDICSSLNGIAESIQNLADAVSDLTVQGIKVKTEPTE